MTCNRTPDAWLIEACRSRVQEFATQLRLVDDGATPVPNLEWSVADLAQHVCSLPSFWESQHLNGDLFERPSNFAAYVDGARSHITEVETHHLAERIDTEFDDLLTMLADTDGQRWLYGVKTTASNMCGLVLNELVLHGRDLAGVTGISPPSFTRDEANAAVDAILVTTPCFVDASKAGAQPDGVYHVRFRGGNDYTWTKSGGQLTIEQGRPQRADARLNANPATFLLASLGRVGQVRAALFGGMIAYGRRPWRFVGLGSIAIDGI